ncbi:MAG: ribosomal L7Ae/L30e/S12e/Gadd45 family protein [Nitrososphaerales archaeon]
MVTSSDLEKQLKVATRTGKYVVGRREVLGSLKGSKLLVWSSSANVPPEILGQCKSLSIPAIRFDGNPIELGRMCGIPFKVSVIAVKSSGDADLDPFGSAQDYSLPQSSYTPQQVTQAPEKETPIENKEEPKTEAVKPKRKRAKKTEEKEEKPRAKKTKSKKKEE